VTGNDVDCKLVSNVIIWRVISW